MSRTVLIRRRSPRNNRSHRAAVSFPLERLEERSLLSLVAAYSFDEASGTVLHDTSGLNNNGTISSATWSAAGKFGDALSFSGSLNSWVTVPDSASLDLTTGMTLEAWVDPASLSSPDNGWASALSKEHQNSSNDIAYALYAAQGTGTGPAGHVLVNGTDSGAGGPSVLPLNTWSFLSATYDGTTLREYVNGALVGSQAVGGSITTTGDPLRIGGDWSGEMFTGLIDNVRVYSTALTQAQIQSDMSTPVLAPTPPAVTSESPAPGATGVATNAAVTATFNEALSAATVNTTDFTLRSASGAAVTATVSYSSGTNTATLTPSAPLANATTYTATLSGVQSGAGVAMTAPFSWSFTTGTIPAVTSESPASGATGVAVNAPLTATFNEAVQPGSISFTLTGPGSTAVAAALTYNASTNTATLTPLSSLAAGTTYTATVGGATDASGHKMSGPLSWTFTTSATYGPGPFSIWSGAAAPQTADASDGRSVELGVRFTPSISGTITGLRFYKGALNTGAHVADLWSSTGALLATATFTGETASGWQQVSFSQPVAVTAGTTYVASYHTNVGEYAVNKKYFAAAYVSGPLQVPANGGVYSYGAAGSFPRNSYQGSNYWVDVVLAPGGTTGTAPAVTSESPAPGATGVATNAAVTATFNEALSAATVNTTDFTLRSASGAAVTATVSYSSGTNTATLTPSAPLANATTYTATLSGVQSGAGVAMTAPFSWSFTTGPAPAVTGETPAPGATGVATGTAVTATFNEAVQSGTISFTLATASGTAVPATLSYNASTSVVTLAPNASLANSTTYTATISGVKDTAGDPMATPFSWSFTTAAAQATSTGDPTTLAPSLGPPPSPSPSVIWVSTESALQSAVTNLQSGQTIVIQPGTYNLSSTLYIGLNSNITNVTIRGVTDNFNDVTLLGKGMDNASYGNVPMGISVWHAQNVTIADLSIGRIYDDPIEIKGDQGASAVTVYHVRLFDAGEQFLKVDPPSSGVGASNSAVEYSLIEYTAGPPTTDHGGGIGYTNGIDIHDGQNWLIAHNLIRNLHTPDSDTSNLWNPAILIWNHSSNMTVDGNTIINCDRAIAFGLIDQTTGYDNQGGVVRNNFIYQAPGLLSATRAANSDGQILVWDSPSSQVLFNTILTDGNSANSVQLRWTTTGAVVQGNLSDASILTRDGASYTGAPNYLSATPSMFVNPSTGDLHLVVNTATQANVINKATAVANDPTDWDGTARPAGSPTNIGADAFASTTAPAVTGASPTSGATGIATNAAVTATFNEAVQASSITTSNFVLKNPSGVAVAATVSYNSTTNTATLTPSSPLANSTAYTATISGVTDSSGNTMTSPFSWPFTTGPAPAITSASPASGATGVAASSPVTATFNEAVQSGTISFTLTNSSGTAVPATMTYNSSTFVVTLTPGAALAYSTKYTATVSGAKDAAGDPMSAPVSWSFTTAAAPALTVSSYSPASGATGVATNSAVTATFNLAMLASSITTSTFTLKTASGTAVAATVSYNSSTNTATLTPSSPLANSTTYTAGISAVQSILGTTLSGLVTWSFTTGPAPAVNSESPAPGATGVAVSSPVTATFNEAVQSGTISFTLATASGTAVPATLSYNASTSVVTLTPSVPLANSTTYSATISGAKDAAGDPMAAPVSWSFTTGSSVPVPAVIGESPAPGGAAVPVPSAALLISASALFNEPVQPASIQFTLTDSSGVAVSATLWYSDATNTIMLTPQVVLANSMTYTATISGATDAAGHTMAAPFKWSFTTAAAGAIVPMATSPSPSPNATSVDVGTPIAASFNEPVQPGSIGSANFTLRDASGNIVPGTIAYRDIGSLHTATLKPSAPLAYSASYTATISGVTDSAGNTMAAPYSWSFTTASGSPANTQLPLIYSSNLQYLGGFRVPDNGTGSANSLNYAGQGLAFNPANNSLFLAGYVADDSVAEIGIPGSIVNSSNLSSLATAPWLQQPVGVFARIPNTSNLGDGTWSTKGSVYTGGLTVVNGQLLGTQYVYYDNSGNTVVTHFRFDSLGLSTAKVEGMFQVGNQGLGAAFYDGYMSPIPANWQAALGAPYLTGNAALPIISRTSYGPAVFGFDPATLSASSIAPATPFVYYPSTNPLGQWGGTSPLWDGNTAISGVFFVPGSRTVLFFGSGGTNTFTYGLPTDANDPYRTGKGPHSLNGEYTYKVWAYDANDFLAVKGGQLQPWQLQPYAIWNLDFAQFDGAKYLGGVAFDPATSRLYVTELGGDTQVAYTDLPVVQVLQLTLSAAGGSVASEAAVSGLSTPPTVAPLGAAPNVGIGAMSQVSAPSTAGVSANSGLVPQISPLGTFPDLEGPWQVKRRRMTPQAALTRTASLVHLMTRIPDRIRPLKVDGLRATKRMGDDIGP